MSGPKSPPPGAMPSLPPSPDMQSMMEQAAGQSDDSTGTTGTAAPATSSLPSLLGSSSQKGQARPVGTPLQELKYLGSDVAQGLLSVLPDFMQSIFGIAPTDTPEDAARKKQMFQRYQQMNAEEQQYVQKKLQEEHIKKQKEEEERAQKERAAQMNAQDDLPVPQGKTRGEGGPGMSSKQRTTTKLQSDRKKLKNAA